MKIKKWTALLLVFAMLTLLTACGRKSTEFKTTSSLIYYGDTESKDPLRIFMDIQISPFQNSWDYIHAEEAMNEFLSAVRTDIGEQEIVIEFIANDYLSGDNTATRATAVSRLHVEMLAGGGPDVFIMRYNKTEGAMGWNLDSGDILFKSPQKVMESGLFLPLDDYIENHTKHAEWEKFPQAVMDAGRNTEGQQIIPISYTLPILVYPKEVFDYTPDRLLSWNDMLTDPRLAPFATDLTNCLNYDYSLDPSDSLYIDNSEYLEFVFGKIANYEEGELLFTEEELLQRIREILSLDPEDKYPNAEEGMLGVKLRSLYTHPITLLPLYSDDGGVAARIDYYAAVNRNTDQPEEAFAVIDALLSTEAQQNWKLYTKYFCRNIFYQDVPGGFPMNDELYIKGTESKQYQNEENYNEFCELREQITSAHFDGEPSALLDGLIAKCMASPDEIEFLVHEVYVELERRVRE